MKQKVTLTVMAAAMGLWLASAQAAVPSPQFLGTWTEDLSKAPAPPNPNMPAPKSVTVAIKDLGGGKWSTQVTIELADGSKREQPPQVAKVDGTPTPITGSPRVDSVTVTWPDPRTSVVTLSKGGKTVSTETSKLSADGKTMVHTVDGIGSNGQPYHSTSTLHKQ